MLLHFQVDTATQNQSLKFGICDVLNFKRSPLLAPPEADLRETPRVDLWKTAIRQIAKKRFSVRKEGHIECVQLAK